MFKCLCFIEICLATEFQVIYLKNAVIVLKKEDQCSKDNIIN